MRVKNLVSWAGDKFSYGPDQEIELDEDLAHARVDLGRAAYLSKEDAARKPKVIKHAAPHPKLVAQQNAEKLRQMSGAKQTPGATPGTLAAQLADVNAKLTQSETVNAALLARLDALEKSVAEKNKPAA